MAKIVIIGAGFAGISLIKKLRASLKAQKIVLIDQSGESGFLPLLPDVLGRGIDPGNLSLDAASLSNKLSFDFIRDEVVSVDLEKREVRGVNNRVDYDYLAIASGSKTNFYGNEQIEKYAYKLDAVNDARVILKAVQEEGYDSFVISGGGYTGIEVATNLRKKIPDKRIIIVERAPAILGPLPEWMKAYVRKNLDLLKIEYLTNVAIERMEEREVYFSSGVIINKAMVIQAAGVKTADFIQDLEVEKNPQGRIKVDAYLRLNDRCFVLGDAAYVAYANSYLRMAVQFAIAQGENAAINITNSIKGKKLQAFKPRDLGYVIPMANNRSCGLIFGMKLKGFLPTILHYLMCIYRIPEFRNKAGIIVGLIKNG